MVLCTQCQRLNVESRVPDCTILKGRKCMLCKEYVELEQKIQELQERRRKLSTKMNANHDPFILKLPPEVASHIFILFKGDSQKSQGRRANLSVIFLLGAVCKGWRQLARSTPQLWSTLAFFLPNPEKSVIMDTLPPLIVDWLERSGGLPLTLDICFRRPYASGSIPLAEGLVSIINALNQHSRRWHDVSFNLPPLYLGRLCGSSPPEDLCYLSIHNSAARSHRDTNVKFKMNTQPSPMKFTVSAIPCKAINISWDRLVYLDVSSTSLDGVLEVIRDATLLEICVLNDLSPPVSDFPTSETIIRHPHLRTLELLWNEARVLSKIISSLELPSLESWMLRSEENYIGVDAISFLKRSGSRLKKLDLWQDDAPAFEDFEQLLLTTPHLQCLKVDCNDFPLMVDAILEQISKSPPSASQIGNHTDFLPHLQHLELRSIELHAWDCIPLIFQWPHRKLLRLDIYMEITISDEISSALVQLVDEGIALRIFDSLDDLAPQDYLQRFRDPTASSQTIDPIL